MEFKIFVNRQILIWRFKIYSADTVPNSFIEDKYFLVAYFPRNILHGRVIYVRIPKMFKN